MMIDSIALHMPTPETHIPHRITPETPEHRLTGYPLCFSVSQLLHILLKGPNYRIETDVITASL
jgi:hypothetical protein